MGLVAVAVVGRHQHHCVAQGPRLDTSSPEALAGSPALQSKVKLHRTDTIAHSKAIELGWT
jgi:hypothetical protein